MEPLLFADQLRIMRQPLEKDRARRNAGLNVTGAARLLGAACVACLLVVTLQAAFPRPPETVASVLAQEIEREKP